MRCRPLVGPKVLPLLLALLSFGVNSTMALGQTSNAQEVPKGQITAQTSPTPLDLSDEVIRDVLTNLQQGIEAHSLDRTIAIFDPDNMTNYPQVRDQMRAFFRLHDNIKFRYQLLQVNADKDTGSAIADVEMDPEPSDTLPTERRRTAQMSFQLRRTPAGWRVISLKPMDFFN
jgi:hypothetical protein